MREDSTWSGLTGEQRQKLEGWLFERNLGYAEALQRAHKEFGVQSLFGCAVERRRTPVGE